LEGLTRTTEIVMAAEATPMGSARAWLVETGSPILLFVSLDLFVTLLFLLLSTSPERIGTFRPVDTVAPKLAELLAAGFALGLLASLPQRRLDLSLATICTALVGLLDLDHLPALLGVAQPVRPAHSVTFLALEVFAMFVAFRRRKEVPLIATAAFLGHLAADVGIFAPLTPFSFEYVSLDSLTVPLAVGAAGFALAAGYAKRRGRSTRTLTGTPSGGRGRVRGWLTSRPWSSTSP